MTGALDGALIAVVSGALHERCAALGATDHRPDDHDHGAVAVVQALTAAGWVCTRQEDQFG